MSRRLLLTPGPLTTAARTRQAMDRDWGSRDADFIRLTADIRARLVSILEGGDVFTAVPMQGSGTFAVEAMLGTLVGPDQKVLILENGAYGRRAAEICRRQGRAHATIAWDEDTPVDPDQVARALDTDSNITHVFAVLVETTSGLLNPIDDIAGVVAAAGRRLMIDAMSAFGALPLSAADTVFDAVAASANKCLEGVPGIGFVIVR
ncbi:MAG: aminotransferase class V-fold PLP-dependent enzyme, partial [Alphaproteobacteria bacterium]|nr:aminotransferase class V-fold PLP-dependent enzyme [Alphaproteobacteria bacterium]